MKIIATSIFVENQDVAKQFYTEKLGFELVNDVAVGGGYRWLTVKETNSSNPVEIVLEPNASPIAKNYQEGLFNSGIPVTMFGVDDIEDVQRDLMEKGVEFQTEVKEVDQIKMAVFNDTCGNLIQIIEQ
ncbi:VOC family protein [Staphylococcus gallinarum]|uniref:VOC family protein n=1 Tax=Staphylococcus gallinarum TaxID=1293 RepID=A0A3A0VSK8_STAGA|nr:VOC family protein [Staphylococcus gallinarum]RIP35849.1 VOC family protein [Staphylococcus gallinarum]